MTAHSHQMGGITNKDLTSRSEGRAEPKIKSFVQPTVARKKRIPVEQRAEAAVIAWMRHQTTGYDGMVIPRVKGKRREIRRMLAQRSKELLAHYRRGEAVGAECPLKMALDIPDSPVDQSPA
jgi:hypothetical protein